MSDNPAQDRLTFIRCLRECRQCPNVVAPPILPEGALNKRLMFVGRNPGIQELKMGRPFMGKGGSLFDALLTNRKATRQDFWLTNTVACYTVRDRPPLPAEIANCSGWLEQQLILINPLLVITMGKTATEWFLGKVEMPKVRRRPRECTRAGLTFEVLPVMHPGQALRSDREEIYKDFRKAFSYARRKGLFV